MIPALREWERNLAVWLLGALIVTSILGCAGGRTAENLKTENEALKKRVAELEQKALQAGGEPEESIAVYAVKSTPTDFWLVPEVRKVKRQPDMLKAVLEEIVRHPSNPIPKETKVLDVKVKDFVAYPNFSSEIAKLSAGSKVEALVVAAIANALIKFPGVEKVQILVDGKPAESLAGHIDISGPVGRNETVLLLEGR